jgi:hypothetical protein
MKTTIKEFTVYSLQDMLNDEKLKSALLDKHTNINVDFNFWHEAEIEHHEEQLKIAGYQNVKIHFSGFYSQGDGACFTGDINVVAWIEKNAPVKYARILKLIKAGFIDTYSAEIKHRGHYYHERSTDLFIDFRIYGNLGTSAVNVCGLLDVLVTDIETDIIERGREIYKDLKADYEYLTSEEAIIETLQINDYEFNEDGSIF